MSLPLKEKLRLLLNDVTKTPQLIMEVEGFPLISSIPSQTYIRYGDQIFYGDEIFYGGLRNISDALPYIDISGSTQQITQQMQIDKGGTSSVTSFQVKVVDKDQTITKLIQPSTLSDPLSKKVRLYLALEGTAHPEESVLFFNGIVAGVKANAGNISFNLASPEKLKNLEIFPKISTELTVQVLPIHTTINVTETASFLLPANSGTLRTYLLLNDEIIEYTGKTTTSFTGCVRGQFGTIAATHEINDTVESAYRLIGNLRDLSLKLMLSGRGVPYAKDLDVIAFNNYSTIISPNSIFLARVNFKDLYNPVSGDTVTIYDDITNPSNNGSATILSVNEFENGVYLVTDKTFIYTPVLGAKVSLSSKYDVLPKFSGLEMTPDQVDIDEFEAKYTQLGTNFYEYDFFIKEQVKGSEFINNQILYPSGCYSLPRKTKTSIGSTQPPLGQVTTKKLNIDNVTNAASLGIDRNISNNFYNAVVIRYDKDQVEDKFTRGKIRQSADSTNRIKVANKPLNIDADGVRQESNFDFKLAIQARRFLERYQFAAESLEVEVNYATGFDIEIGDTVVFEGKDLQVSDSNLGTRNFLPRLFEVQNKVMNITGKPIRLMLVDTLFSLSYRYGVISPSSKIDTGSTTSRLLLKRSFGTTLGTQTEGFKWRNFAGSLIRVRSKDYTYDQERTLIGVDPSNDNALLIEPALPSVPLDNYIIDIIKYPVSTDPEISAIYKNIYVFWNKQLPVESGISQTVFTIPTGMASFPKVGYQVFIHNDTYTRKSIRTEITAISGNQITVKDALGFIPVLDDKIEYLGYPDQGKPYTWL